MLRLLVLPLVALLPWMASAQQQDRPSYEIEALVSDGLSRIEGTVKARIPNHGEVPLDRLSLWLYPNVFAQPVAGISDANREYYQPYGKGTGGISFDTLEVDGRRVQAVEAPARDAPAGTHFQLPLSPPIQPGAVVEVRLHFVTKVPRRLGPFSLSHGVLTALGGWHPYLLPPAERPLDRRPVPADFQIRLSVPRGHLALIGGVKPGPDLLVELKAREWADLVVRRSEVQPIRKRGGAVWPLSNRPGEEWELTAVPNPPPLPSDWVADDLADLLAKLDRWADAQPGIPVGGQTQLVVIPLRSEIALATPGIVAVSDRAYSVTPIGFLRRIHGRGIARAYMAHRFLAGARRCETSGMTPQIADGLGALYADRFAVEVLGSGGDSDTMGLLGALDFIPSVDEFIRSPRSPFSHLYFQPVEIGRAHV